MNQRVEEKPNEVVRRSQWMLERFQKATESHSRNKNYQFWQYGNHAVEIYTKEFMWSKLDYIHLNPVRAGIIEKASEYIYSSASNYVNGKGIIEVTLTDHPIVNVLNVNNVQKYEQY